MLGLIKPEGFIGCNDHPRKASGFCRRPEATFAEKPQERNVDVMAPVQNGLSRRRSHLYRLSHMLYTAGLHCSNCTVDDRERYGVASEKAAKCTIIGVRFSGLEGASFVS